MAKESMKARERKRERMAAQYADRRAELTKILKSADTSEEMQEKKWDAMLALQKLPANSAKVRVHNRCGLTGRPRGYMRQFGISRVTFREMALAGSTTSLIVLLQLHYQEHEILRVLTQKVLMEEVILIWVLRSTLSFLKLILIK